MSLNKAQVYASKLSQMSSTAPRTDTALRPFSYDIKFDPFPSNIVITNPYQCTETDLKPCKLDDALSCAGCQNLIARCTHFETDAKIVVDGEVVGTVPKNDTSDDGYCLATTSVVDSCNPFHGDLAIAKANKETELSQLICICKNPGAVGNTTLLGNCSTPFVCDGKVEDINVPLSQIKCVCGNDRVAATAEVSQLPICQRDSVLTHDYTNHQYPSDDFVDIDRFNADVRANVSASKLRNPCTTCLISGKRVDGELVERSDGGYQCRCTSPSCLPIRRSSDARLLRGDIGPDAVIDLKWKVIKMLPHMSSSDWRELTAVILKSDNAELFETMGLTEDAYEMNLTKNQTVWPRMYSNDFYVRYTSGVWCEGAVFTYNCYVSPDIDHDLHTTSGYSVPNFRIDPLFGDYKLRYLQYGYWWVAVGSGNVNWNHARDVRNAVTLNNVYVDPFEFHPRLWDSNVINNNLRFLYSAFILINSDGIENLTSNYHLNNTTVYAQNDNDYTSWKSASLKLNP